MTETVMNTKTLPEFLFGMIQTEKVSVKEVNGVIQLMPVISETVKTAKQEKKPFSSLRGILRDKVWMSDDFNAPLEDMKEYM